MDILNEIPPLPENEHQWYYEHFKRREGPVTKEVIEEMLKKKTLTVHSIVWRKGYSEWKPINQTELIDNIDVPPPLHGSSINNIAVWLIAFAPILGAIVKPLFFENSTPIVFWFILNSLLVLWDSQELSRAGYESNTLWGIFFLPVYLWKRSDMTKQSKAYFWIWIVSAMVGGSASAMDGVMDGINETFNHQSLPMTKVYTIPESTTTPDTMSAAPAASEMADTTVKSTGNGNSAREFSFHQYTIKVFKFKNPYIPNNREEMPKYKKKFVAADIQFINTTDKPIEYNSMYEWNLIDGDGYKYDPSILFSNNDHLLLSGTINPGQKARGWLIFEVPKENRVFTLQFAPVEYSGNTVDIHIQ